MRRKRSSVDLVLPALAIAATTGLALLIGRSFGPGGILLSVYGLALVMTFSLGRRHRYQYELVPAPTGPVKGERS